MGYDTSVLKVKERGISAENSLSIWQAVLFTTRINGGTLI